MSLRIRLFLIILMVNLGLFGVVIYQAISGRVDFDKAVHEQEIELTTLVQGKVLVGDYEVAKRYHLATIRSLLEPDVRRQIRERFEDVLYSNSQRLGFAGSVEINPLGAAHRDPARFPIQDIRKGIHKARSTGRIEVAGGGFCIPIHDKSESGEINIVAGAWFKPRIQVEMTSLAAYLVPIFLGTLVLIGISFWTLDRGVVVPLRRLGAAASAVGAGHYDVRVERLRGGPEFDAFVDAFNNMAKKVQNQHQVLEQEVQAATEEAKRKERALLMSARLASMGTLAAGIAHEINNPIGGMINAIRRVAQNEHLTARDRLYVELIQEGLERVSGIARRVLDFSPRQMDAVPFRFADAVDGARGLVEHRLTQEGVEFSTKIPATLPDLVGDRHEFQQVLLNLFINSLDVFSGGTEHHIWVRAESVDGLIHIWVEDDGAGMAPADLGQVFDPFFSGKGKPDASGIGMFIAYQIIENHGGSMEVDSDLGKGFRVHLRMPVAET